MQPVLCVGYYQLADLQNFNTSLALTLLVKNLPVECLRVTVGVPNNAKLADSRKIPLRADINLDFSTISSEVISIQLSITDQF